MNARRQRTFSQRIGFCITCVMPAELLSAIPSDEQDWSSLRADASEDQLSYIQVFRMIEESLYLARVAATPENIANGYTVLLNEEQLFFALPWDTRLQEKPTDRIVRQMRAHALELQPHMQAVLLLEGRGDGTGHEESFIPVDTVEISVEALQDAIMPLRTQCASTRGKRRNNRFHLQQVFLRVMIDKLKEQLYLEQAKADALRLKNRYAHLLQIQRLHRHMRRGHLVNAVPYFSTTQCQMMWKLTVSLPADAFSSSATIGKGAIPSNLRVA